MKINDDSATLLERVKQAMEQKTPLAISGGYSKQMLGNIAGLPEQGSTLSMLDHCGVIAYDPTELVITVRAGTTISDLNQALDETGQMLPFEPPELPGSTIGGVLACGLAGPRRPFNGSARDFVLGTRVINGLAQDLSFGGQVMKNVAGYDVSRVQIGAWGTLGVLLDVSMKVLPKPEVEVTIQHTVNANDLQSFAPLLRRPLPLSAAMLIDDQRYIRLSGSGSAVESAAAELAGTRVDDSQGLWASVRDHTHSFFNTRGALWRISVAEYTPALELEGEWLYEWGGGQRWLKTAQSADEIFTAAKAAGGHASRFSPASNLEPAFQPLEGPMLRLQARLRDSFDPQRLFNRGRFHPELDTDITENGAVIC